MACLPIVPVRTYIFILCVQGLSLYMLLKKAESQRRIKGVAVARNAPKISHLLFADDCLLFSQANMENATSIHFDCIS